MSHVIPYKLLKPATFVTSLSNVPQALLFYNDISTRIDYLVKSIIKELNKAYKDNKLFTKDFMRFSRNKIDKITIHTDEANNFYFTYNIYEYDYKLTKKLVEPKCQPYDSFEATGKRAKLMLNTFIEIVNFYKEILIYLTPTNVCTFTYEIEMSLYFTGSNKSITELSLYNMKHKRLLPTLLIDIYKVKKGRFDV